MKWVIAQAILFIAVLFVPLEGQVVLPGWLRAATHILSLLGFLILFWAAYDLRSSLSVRPEPLKSGQLKMSGVYGIVRHPMYLAVWLILGAGIIRSESFIKFALLFVLIAFFVLKTRHEEKLLTVQYPEYSNYMKRVGQFFPRIRT